MASDLPAKIDNHEERITSLEDTVDQNSTDLQSYQDDLANTVNDIQQTQSDDEQNIGQLMFPLSQDTIDLITEQAPAIINSLYNNNYIGLATLVNGIVTVTNNLVTATSIILLSYYSISGPLGALHYIPTTGTFNIESLKFSDQSRNATDEGTIIYFILKP
jgi:hypothetical protein